MQRRFFGREDQLSQLSELLKKRTPSLVTCRGRRRIGKSTLIEHFAKISGLRFIVFEGVAPQPRAGNVDQLRAFGRQFAEQFAVPMATPESWFDAFRLLGDALAKLKDPAVVLLDEISWMGKFDDNFAGELKYAWDRRFAKLDRLMLVVCGSVSSWINRNILENTGFVGRISLDLTLGELPLADSAKFWGERGARVSSREILDVLAVTGGVPKYLDEMIPSESADENIARMCFQPNGYLFRDFEDIFCAVFGNAAKLKRKALVLLAEGARSASEIADALGTACNGQLLAMLKELALAGFVGMDRAVNPKTGKRAREVSYRLKDNYSRFYLKYIFPRREEIESGHFEFASAENLPGWETVLGLQFENLVLNNFKALLPQLHLDGVQILSAGPFVRSSRNGEGGVQIDLLIETRRAWHVVEIKRKAEIGVEVEKEVAEKISRLGFNDGRSIRTALVYDGRLTKGVRGNGYFDALVSADMLLG